MTDALQCLKSLHHTEEEKRNTRKIQVSVKNGLKPLPMEICFLKKKKNLKKKTVQNPNRQVGISNVVQTLHPAFRRLASAGSVCSGLRTATETFPCSCSHRDWWKHAGVSAFFKRANVQKPMPTPSSLRVPCGSVLEYRRLCLEQTSGTKIKTRVYRKHGTVSKQRTQHRCGAGTTGNRWTKWSSRAPYFARVCPRPSSALNPSLALLPCRTKRSAFRKLRRCGLRETPRLRLALTWGSCACRSLRSSCPCRVCLLCLRSAATAGDTQSRVRGLRSDTIEAQRQVSYGVTRLTWLSLSAPIPRELSRLSITMLSW